MIFITSERFWFHKVLFIFLNFQHFYFCTYTRSQQICFDVIIWMTFENILTKLKNGWVLRAPPIPFLPPKPAQIFVILAFSISSNNNIGWIPNARKSCFCSNAATKCKRIKIEIKVNGLKNHSAKALQIKTSPFPLPHGNSLCCSPRRNRKTYDQTIKFYGVVS